MADDITTLWAAHEEIEDKITALAMKDIAELIQSAVPNTVTQIDLEWIESPSWSFTWDDDDRGVHEVEDVYEVTLPDGSNLADELAGITPFFWEHSPSWVVPYTKDAEVDSGELGLDTATFTPERMLNPRTAQEVHDIEQERYAKFRAEARARYEAAQAAVLMSPGLKA